MSINPLSRSNRFDWMDPMALLNKVNSREPLSQREVAAFLGISVGRVGQIEGKAMRKIRDSLTVSARARIRGERSQ